jgi:hypothetical protein
MIWRKASPLAGQLRQLSDEIYRAAETLRRAQAAA